MTNVLVGDVYAKIIEEVVAASSNDFEESGVSQTTLQELQQEWHAKLSMRGVAQMPWDPKPAPPPPATTTPTNLPSATGNGLSNSYSYESTSNGVNGGARIKAEPGTETHYGPNGYPANTQPQPQGGLARAQQLVQASYGSAANATVNAMQRGGLALPGQQQQQRPQGLQLPGQNQYAQQMQQQQQAAMRHQQQQQHQNIKVENDVPASYGQTDGADEGLEEWKTMLAQRRAMSQEQITVADNMMRDQIMNLTANLESGLMVPLNQQPRRPRNKTTRNLAAVPELPQTDGAADGDDVKEEDDEDAINSDLDDTDDEGPGQMGDDDDDNGDSILCTYDKVQRVKNKWKCTLKDGIMSVDGKEYVFHKGTGEFEW